MHTNLYILVHFRDWRWNILSDWQWNNYKVMRFEILYCKVILTIILLKSKAKGEDQSTTTKQIMWLLDHAKGVTWEFHNSNPHKPTSLKSQTFIEIMQQPLIGEGLYNDEVWNLLFIYFWVNEFRPFWNVWSLKGSFLCSWSRVHWHKTNWLFKEWPYLEMTPTLHRKHHYCYVSSHVFQE